jgi:peptide chain release factor 2
LIFPTFRAGCASSGGFFDPAKLNSRLAELEQQMTVSGFWDQREAAQKIMSEATRLREQLKSFAEIERRVDDLPLLAEMAREDGGAASARELEQEFVTVSADFDRLEVGFLLAGPHDAANAILNIHAGAGGTEACDWSNMLLRMFQRYCERRGFKVSIMDILQGEEAGIKSVTLTVEGENAYGYLKAETGVHRLVRISPFNAAGKRQTSFASVDVVAEIDDDVAIEVAEKDLRVDVYRAGGHGGQGVNTTDSAVRITHLPTGLVVTCQNERSQIKNRAAALKVLKSRLYEVEMDKKRAELEKHYSEKGEIGWGRQIRSYVLQPYQMVKDLRTGEATSNTQAVLDGDLDAFVSAFLKGKKRSDADVDED